MNSRSVSRLFLDQDAPRLRTLSLSDLSVPLVCPAFANVTRLTLVGGRGRIRHVFEVMPQLEHLEVADSEYEYDFPLFPASSRLRVLKIRSIPLRLLDILRLGYARVGELAVSDSYDRQMIIDAAALFQKLPSELCVSADCRKIELSVYPSNGGIFTFTVHAANDDTFCKLVCASGAAFSKLESLVLPASLSWDKFRGKTASVLLDSAAVAHLPALETIFIECARSRDPADILRLPEFLLGKINAPALTSISVVASENALDFCALEHIDVSHLVSLITNTLICDDKAALEISIGDEFGILVDGDVEQLINCV